MSKRHWIVTTTSNDRYKFVTKNSEWGRDDILKEYLCLLVAVAEGERWMLEYYLDTCDVEELKPEQFYEVNRDAF